MRRGHHEQGLRWVWSAVVLLVACWCHAGRAGAQEDETGVGPESDEIDEQWALEGEDEAWSSAGRRFPGSAFELSAPELNAIVALRADIARSRRTRRILGGMLVVPASLVGLAVALHADVECPVECSDEDEERRRRAGRLGAVGMLGAAGVGWLMTRVGNAIRDHREAIRDIRRHRMHLSLAWR